jgi:DNA replication and repair protein RecF
MRLRKLELEEFRSFRHLLLTVDEPGFCAIGPNASGKSTLLEAIFMLATTRSPRTSSEREIANWESGKELGLPPYARILGGFARADGQHEVEIGMSVGERGTGSLKKQVRLDARSVRATDAVGQLKAVLFTPEDVALLSGSPSHRRRYLDIAISQASRPYLRALSRYGRVLEQRNSLLRSFVRARISAASPRIEQELGFWNAELNIYAVEVLSYRLHWIDDLGRRAKHYFAELTGDDTFALSYRSRLGVTTNDEQHSGTDHFRSQQYRQFLSASYANTLSSSLSEELARGVTVIGPHRDDFAVELGPIDLGRFGSRGQQRLAIVAMKLAELDFLSETANEPPLLLLDDVFSELDSKHRLQVTTALDRTGVQVCLTATDSVDIGFAELPHLPRLRLNAGSVTPVSE